MYWTYFSWVCKMFLPACSNAKIIKIERVFPVIMSNVLPRFFRSTVYSGRVLLASTRSVARYYLLCAPSCGFFAPGQCLQVRTKSTAAPSHESDLRFWGKRTRVHNYRSAGWLAAAVTFFIGEEQRVRSHKVDAIAVLYAYWKCTVVRHHSRPPCMAVRF